LFISSFYCFVVLEDCRFSLIAFNKEQNQLTTKVRQRSYLNNKEKYVIEKDALIFNIESSQINRKKQDNSQFKKKKILYIEDIVLLKI